MLNRTNQYLFPDAINLPDDVEVMNIIGTTYSCSLDMIIAIILWTDGQSKAFAELSPPEQLKSLFELAGKTKIWCNRGYARSHEAPSELIAMLNDTLLEVKPDKQMTSFHPKFLLIRYRLKTKNTVRYRIVITSRNFNPSDSWDFIFVIEGVPSKNVSISGKTIADFIRSFEGGAIDLEMLQEIEKLSFDLDAESKDQYGNLSFVYQTPKETQTLLDSLSSKYDNALVVSPFVSNTFMYEILRRCHGKTRLVSTQDSLDKLAPEITDNPACEAWSVDGDNEDFANVDTGHVPDEDNYSFSLHAKIYQFEIGSNSQFFLGSANATQNGWLGHNTECGIMFDRKSYNINNFWDETFRKDKATEVSFLHRYIRQENKKNNEKEILDKVHSTLCSLEIILTIHSKMAEYSISIPNVAPILTSLEHSGYEIRIATFHMKITGKDAIVLNEFLNGPQKREYNSPASLMPFVEVGIYKAGTMKKQFILRAEVNGDIITNEDKMQSIIRSIITDSSKFFAYLRMLITGTIPIEVDNMPQNSLIERSRNNPAAHNEDIGFTMEDLLLFLAREPEQVKKVDRFVSYCKDIEMLKQYSEVEQFLMVWEQLKASFQS